MSISTQATGGKRSTDAVGGKKVSGGVAVGAGTLGVAAVGDDVNIWAICLDGASIKNPPRREKEPAPLFDEVVVAASTAGPVCPANQSWTSVAPETDYYQP